MKVHDAARKHGILPEDAIQAATWAVWVVDLDADSPARQLRLGFDTQGRLLETVVLTFDSGKHARLTAITLAQFPSSWSWTRERILPRVCRLRVGNWVQSVRRPFPLRAWSCQAIASKCSRSPRAWDTLMMVAKLGFPSADSAL